MTASHFSTTATSTGQRSKLCSRALTTLGDQTATTTASVCSAALASRDPRISLVRDDLGIEGSSRTSALITKYEVPSAEERWIPQRAKMKVNDPRRGWSSRVVQESAAVSCSTRSLAF